MKKYLKRIIIVLVITFIGIQFIPRTYNLSDTISENDISNTLDIPENIQLILETSCYDCHSNSTEYPWYNKIQPISYFMEAHITEGKEELNFSEVGSYSNRKLKSKLKSIINQIDDEEMPMFSYTLIHRNAILSEENKKKIKNWVSENLNIISK
ncbi:MAG: heme-binding domain-containing protein [Flavobacteriaceae bacterium]